MVRLPEIGVDWGGCLVRVRFWFLHPYTGKRDSFQPSKDVHCCPLLIKKPKEEEEEKEGSRNKYGFFLTASHIKSGHEA